MQNKKAIVLSGLVLFMAACGSTRQIETSSPRPVNIPGDSRHEAAGMGSMMIDLETGETSLPAEIQVLRFRIDEIRLHTDEGEWVTFPTELNNFEIIPERYVNKTILSTRVQPVMYDSIALRISDVFVLFGENAGGPISLPRNEPVKLAVDMHPEVGEATQVRITFEPEASLYKNSNCRWFFVPFWTAKLE